MKPNRRNPPRFGMWVTALALVAACAPATARKQDPLGQMPTAVTKAQPEWIPFQIRAGQPVEVDPREKHLKELRQLTFGGENAEAYWSPDGRRIVFQSTRDGAACDQIYVMELGDGATRRVSSGAGRTTCSYFAWPKGDRIFYSSTQAAGPACPPKPDRSHGYVWPLDDFDVYVAEGEGFTTRSILASPGYDAETTVAPDGSRLVFTSTRDGDLELYTAKLDGSDVRRVTNAVGYDGGAFFSPDSSKLVWRASRPAGKDLEEYKQLLAKKLVKPTQLEIWVGGVDGQRARAVTKLGKASFAPAFLPDSRRVVFASNVDAAPPAAGKPPNFELYVVDPDAPPTQEGMPPVERITFTEDFDGFPMFSPDGEHVVFASNRFGAQPGDTNLFVAKWVE